MLQRSSALAKWVCLKPLPGTLHRLFKTGPDTKCARAFSACTDMHKQKRLQKHNTHLKPHEITSQQYERNEGWGGPISPLVTANLNSDKRDKQEDKTLGSSTNNILISTALQTTKHFINLEQVERAPNLKDCPDYSCSFSHYITPKGSQRINALGQHNQAPEKQAWLVPVSKFGRKLNCDVGQPGEQ